MTVVNGPSAGTNGAEGTSPPAPATEVPVRADGVQLIGEMKGSGYRQPPALARARDGQTIQLTPLLYLVLATVDGRRDFAEIGRGRRCSAREVGLGGQRAHPRRGPAASRGAPRPRRRHATEVQKSNPLLALRFKYAVTDHDRTRRLTAPFGWLFNPVVVIVVLAALVAVSWWVLFEKGLASATYEAFDKPALLLLVVVVTVLSAGFHEFGHAAAARRGGATPGAMGAGIYLVWPAFYTDVTDSYRLGRWGRVLTDLGGLYFNAIVAVGIAGAWLAHPVRRAAARHRHPDPADGAPADPGRAVRRLPRAGRRHRRPDLFQRIKPTLLGVLPWRWKHPESTVLKPWARAVVTLWVLLVVPLLVFSLVCMVLALPRILGTAWASAGKQ